MVQCPFDTHRPPSGKRVDRGSLREERISMTSENAAKKPTYSPKRSVKNYLIDSRLQLKYAGLLVAVTLVIGAALFVFLWRTSHAVVDESQKVVEKSQVAAQQTQRAIGEALKNADLRRKWYVNNPMFAKNPKLLDLVTEPSRTADDQLRAQQAEVARQQEALAPQHAQVVRQQRTMLWGIIGALIALIVVIGFMGIYVTHKVAGPIYKMRLLLRQLAEGKLVGDPHLRRGDELQDFMGAFSSMVDAMRARQQKELVAIDQALELARAGGAQAEKLAPITDVRDELKRSLEE
jgi:nitrogen fixation/metabolism regulation signal transduction histidine kinase